ncbi:hypothetical protein Pcinc_043645 [Petrolisthes cinctipes]|uniref:Uncharacterized protein n=1 Tax=Petrolisthes cinctipes TaxID=88211 RepID=A0AAE1BFJ6_PETCI|nr:hypothetical protein Pcinc_043645 [Petrolisthes cinctipes]
MVRVEETCDVLSLRSPHRERRDGGQLPAGEGTLALPDHSGADTADALLHHRVSSQPHPTQARQAEATRRAQGVHAGVHLAPEGEESKCLRFGLHRDGL